MDSDFDKITEHYSNLAKRERKLELMWMRHSLALAVMSAILGFMLGVVYCCG